MEIVLSLNQLNKEKLTAFLMAVGRWYNYHIKLNIWFFSFVLKVFHPRYHMIISRISTSNTYGVPCYDEERKAPFFVLSLVISPRFTASESEPQPPVSRQTPISHADRNRKAREKKLLSSQTKLSIHTVVWFRASLSFHSIRDAFRTTTAPSFQPSSASFVVSAFFLPPLGRLGSI